MTGNLQFRADNPTHGVLDGLDGEDEFLASTIPALESEDEVEGVLAEGPITECRELVHSESSENHHPADKASRPPSAPGGQSRDIVAELDADEAERRRPRDGRAVTEVKHVNKDALFNLISLPELTRMLLASFLKRRSRNTWMCDQRLYLQEASLAAAHQAMAVHAALNQGRCADGTLSSLALSGFDGGNFLNCGTRVAKDEGQGAFIRCHQPFYCRQCNRWERLEPAKEEFLPKFDRASAWYGVTVVGVSDPEKAGVRVRTYDEEGVPHDHWLYRLAEHGSCERLPRFNTDDEWFYRSRCVSEATYLTANWLTNNLYFDGLHVVPDLSFTFFRDEFGGVGHTVNPHIHGYGNTHKVIDAHWGQHVYHGATACASKAGGLEFAYMDILLVPAPTVAALEKAMNYVLKPFKFAEWYIDGLQNGCSLIDLNYAFHDVVFGAEELLPVGAPGQKFGNMSMKAGGHYLGRPPLKEMSSQQLKVFRGKLDANDLWGWEIERYERHLDFVARKRRRAGNEVPENLQEVAA